MIAPEFRNQLMTSLRSAVDAFNSGSNPNEAIAKAASAADFNAEQTRRLCETFNTARTLYHFERHPTEKSAAFDLADADEVLAKLYRPAAAKKATTGLPDYAEYEIREVNARDGELVDASADLFPKAAEALPTVEAQAERLYRITNTFRQVSDEAVSDADKADIVAAQDLQKLAYIIVQDFDWAGADKFARFSQLFADNEFKPVWTKLAELLPERIKLTEEDMVKVGRVFSDADLAQHKELFTHAKWLMEESASIRAAGATFQKEATDVEQAFMDIVCPGAQVDDVDSILNFSKEAQTTLGYKQPKPLTRYTVGELLDDNPSDSTLDVKEQQRPFGSAALEAASAASSAASKGVGDAAGKYISSGMEKMIKDPIVRENKKITERLKNRQREVLLQDLIVSDPVLGEADPKLVANAYMSVMQIAPEVSLNKEVVRSILRQAVHATSISPYDASSWAELEKVINETRGTLPARKGVEDRK